MGTSFRAATGLTLIVCALLVTPGAQSPPPVSVAAAATGERVDLDAIYKIKAEGLEQSQVMDTLWYLTDVYGPRLTNSPNIRAAAAWATKRMTEWGLTNARQVVWGQFGRGWVNEVEKAKNRTKSQVRAKVEHSIGVIKRIFGFAKVRYRGLAKNLHRLEVTAALANLYLSRRRLLHA